MVAVDSWTPLASSDLSMWSTATHWFDVALASGLLLLGHVLFGRFAEHKPLWRRLLKAALGVALFVVIAVYLGRTWMYAFVGVLAVGVVVVHGWWLPRNGVHGLTAEPRERYYELLGLDSQGKRRDRAS
jgi:hypothetical protein